MQSPLPHHSLFVQIYTHIWLSSLPLLFCSFFSQNEIVLFGGAHFTLVVYQLFCGNSLLWYLCWAEGPLGRNESCPPSSLGLQVEMGQGWANPWREFISVIPEWSSGFHHFLQFKSEVGNKEFMFWATVSSWSWFYWLYRASPSLAANNIINLILVLAIWWHPCVEFSLVLLEECLLWPVCSLSKTLLAFALLHSVLQGQICLLFQLFLDFLLLLLI